MSESSHLLSKLKKAELVALAEAALSHLSVEERSKLLEAFVPTKKPKPKRAKRLPPKPASLRKKVRKFVDESLAGEYWDCEVRKNERGFWETPQATETWCRRVENLCSDSLLLARDGEDAVVAEVLELLLDLMDKSHGDREIVWADEWGVDWNVHANFKRLLRAFFEALSRTTSPEVFARRGVAIANQWTWKDHDAEKLLRRSAKKEYRTALERELKEAKR